MLTNLHEKNIMNILITGSNGFVGSHLARELRKQDQYNVRGAIRQSSDISVFDVDTTVVGNINADTEWTSALYNVDVVVHTAARVHIMSDAADDPLTNFRIVNVAGTLNLARQAAALGIRRFVFMSSIKVNGEQTHSGIYFTANDIPAPEDPYGISKFEAEQGLLAIAAETGMEVVIIRPPLVYGPGVKGNFASLIRLVEKGIPLPLGAIHNQRSLVALDNLIDLVVTCMEHPAAANEVFLASDGQDLSTNELLRSIAKAMGKSSRLFPVPASLLLLGATLLGRKPEAQRLLGSLQVDIAKAQNMLAWEPPFSVEEGLKRCFVMEPKE